jgi:hypothetical protein
LISDSLQDSGTTAVAAKEPDCGLVGLEEGYAELADRYIHATGGEPAAGDLRTILGRSVGARISLVTDQTWLRYKSFSLLV